MKLPTAKLSTTRTLQVIAALAHLANVLLGINGFIPMQDVPYILAAIAAAQCFVNEIAHGSTPGGAQAAEPVDEQKG